MRGFERIAVVRIAVDRKFTPLLHFVDLKNDINRSHPIPSWLVDLASVAIAVRLK